MAGAYADVLAAAFQPDLDGSVGFLHSGAAITTLTTAQLKAWTDGTAGNPSGSFTFGGLVFPQLRTIVAVQGHFPGGTYVLQTSADTTNGQDGTWTSRTGSVNGTAHPLRNSYADTRNNQAANNINIAGVKGVRFNRSGWGGDTNWYNARFYGFIDAGQTPDRLRLWHPTLDQELGAAAFDFGNVQRGASPIKQFRVKNNSAGLTANGINITREFNFLTDPAPSVLAMLNIDNNGGGYAVSQNIGALAPGAISNIQSLRFAALTTASLGGFRQRLRVEAGSWS